MAAKKVIQPGIVLPPLKWVQSANHSDRHDEDIRMLVYHESAGHYKGDIATLCNDRVPPKNRVSAHGVLREDGGEFTQLVRIRFKAWHAANANGFSIGIEHSNMTPKGYSTEHQLQESARIFAWLAVEYEIPVRIARTPQERGICRHLDLGAFGGGHTQCGMGDNDFHRWMEMIHEQVQRGGFREDYMKR